MRQDFDVIVVGAGPAGSTVSRHLAASGLRTLVLDRCTFPRPKPCGNLISGAAQVHLDLPLPGSIIRGRCVGGDFRLQSGERLVIRVPFEVAVYAYRTDFDHFLLQAAEQAGAVAHCGEEIRAVREGPNAVEVRLAQGQVFHGRMLVGADGVTGMTARLVRGFRFRRAELGVGAYTTYPVTAPGGERFAADLFTLDLSAIRGGYSWLFPQGDYLNVGVGGAVADLPAPRQALRVALERFGLRAGGPLFCHPLPIGGLQRRIVSPRILLVGDAAGFVDRITGDGISWAILSGRLAAQALQTAFCQGRPERAPALYRRLVRRQIDSELKASLFFHRVLTWGAPLIGRLRPRVAHAFLERHLAAIAGRLSYRQFVLWALPRLPLALLRSLLPDSGRRVAVVHRSS
jgi:geranylgeranyl reductase family protein